MEVILILIPLSAVVVLGAIAMFFWAVDAGQFEDIDRQGRTSLFEEATPTASPNKSSTQTQSRSS